MAIYKPNNFYPYQQEVDMESIGGNTFTCQANTDGGLVSGAKVKILSSIDNAELYENIYQFEENDTVVDVLEDGSVQYSSQNIKKPYRNKEIVDIPIDAYEIFPKYSNEDKKYVLYDISFQSLCDTKIEYEQKKHMCPYNLYKIKKDHISFFKIIVEIKNNNIISYESIHLNDIKIIPHSYNNLFNIYFDNVDDFTACYKKDIEDGETSVNECRFFITLKNGYDYLWNVRLYEHYFDEYINKGTFISDGYITGTTKNVFWYNLDINEEIKKNDNDIKKDNFLEVIADDENSDIFRNQIVDNGNIMTGNFKYIQNNDYSNIESMDTDEYLLNGISESFADGTSVTSLIEIDYHKNDSGLDKAIMLKNFFNIDEETKQIVKSENKNTWLYKGARYVPVRNTHDYQRNCSYKQLKGWYFLENVNIDGINEDNSFKFDLNYSEIGSSVYYFTYDYSKYNKNSDENNGTSNFIVVPNTKTHVIVKEKISDKKEGQLIRINGKDYYARVLSPLPFNGNNYQFRYFEYHEYNNNVRSRRQDISLEMCFDKDSNNNPCNFINFNNIFDENALEGDSVENNDIVCFQKNDLTQFKYNCIIDINNVCIPFISRLFSSLEEGDIIKSTYPFFQEYIEDGITVSLDGGVEKKSKCNLYKIKVYNSKTDKVSYFLDIKSSNKYKICGFFKKLPYTGKLETYQIKYKIYEKNNPEIYEEKEKEIIVSKSSSSEYDYDYFEIDINNGDEQNIFISTYYLNPCLEIEFPISSLVTYEDLYFYDIKIKSDLLYSDVVYLNDNSVDISEHVDNMYIQFLGKKEKNSNSYDANLGIAPGSENYFLEEDYDYLLSKTGKIKQYDRVNNSIRLEDENYQTKLLNIISTQTLNNYSCYYKLFYKQREKITWVTKNMGIYQNINKIETENEFNVNLKNNAKINLYPVSDNNTYNSFFGVKDTNLNVENIYIRFPEYIGKDYLNNELKDNDVYYKIVDTAETITYYTQTGISSGETTYSSNTHTGVIKGQFYCSSKYYSAYTKSNGVTISSWNDGDGSKVGCPISLYGTKVREEVFNNLVEKDENGETLKTPYIKNKLFKVTSYNPDTGEFVLAGGLARIILTDDSYEVWKKEIIEGSNNEYDITESISTYTRLYPNSERYDDVAVVSSSSPLFKDGIKIMNSNTKQIFIQPNINFSSDNNVTPYLILDSTESKLSFPYNAIFLNSIFTLNDITFEKLDNSQWLISYVSDKENNLIPGMSYKLYTDWSDSLPSSYFYARSVGEIELKYGELSNVNKKKKSSQFSILDYEDLRESLYNLEDHYVGENCMVSGMNIYFIANIKNSDVGIKRYRYRIYNDEMRMIWDSTDIWDNIMEYELKGIEPNKIYFLMFECEDEYGYEYFYEKTFYSQYTFNNIDNRYISLTNLCYQNAIHILIEPDLFKKEGAIFENIEDIQIYRKDSTGKILLINSINVYDDKIYTGIGEDDYKYGFVDYGVYNHEYYDYLFVFSMKEYQSVNFKNYSYVVSTSSIKTSFDSWTIVNIVKNQNFDYYEVSGDIWSFKYNLENSEIIHNTSVTTWNTLGKYGQLGFGERGYDSSGLTCLLGDVGEYSVFDGKKEVKKYGYHEKITSSDSDLLNIEYNNSYSNNIDKYKNWKKFCRTPSLKLLKDMSGNMWIVGITENPSTNINTNSIEQMKIISFEWMECMDSENLSILGRLSSYDKKSDLINSARKVIGEYWEIYSWNEDYSLYELKKINKELKLDSMVVYGSVNVVGMFAQGLLITQDNPFKNSLGEYNEISEYIFEQTLFYSDNSIENLFLNNSKIKSIQIILNNNISNAKYAFKGCTNLTTKNGGFIEINTSNYINTMGMLDETTEEITVRWNEALTNETTDLLTYVELYEQYWNKDNIVLDCPQMALDLQYWTFDKEDLTIAEKEDGIEYNCVIYLKKYFGTRENIFIPKFFKENNLIHKIILSDEFIIE